MNEEHVMDNEIEKNTKSKQKWGNSEKKEEKGPIVINVVILCFHT